MSWRQHVIMLTLSRCFIASPHDKIDPYWKVWAHSVLNQNNSLLHNMCAFIKLSHQCWFIIESDKNLYSKLCAFKAHNRFIILNWRGILREVTWFYIKHTKTLRFENLKIERTSISFRQPGTTSAPCRDTSARCRTCSASLSRTDRIFGLKKEVIIWLRSDCWLG